MKKTRAWLLCLLLAAWLPAQAAEQPQEIVITNATPEGHLEYTLENGLLVITNRAVAIFGDSVLTADRITSNQQTMDALAEGNVELLRGGKLWKGERLFYNFQTKAISSGPFRF